MVSEASAYWGRDTQTSRPARPARCVAEDLLMSRVNNVSTPMRVGLVEMVTIAKQ